MNKIWIRELAATWNLFFSRKFNSDDALPSAALFAVPGFLIGFFFALTGKIADLLFGTLAASITAGILFPLIYELLTEWKGSKNLTSFLELRLNKFTPLEALTSKAMPSQKLTPIFLFVSFYCLRVLAFGRIVYFSPVLLIFVFTAAYFIRGTLASCSNGETDPLLEIPEKQKPLSYLLTGAIFFLTAILTFHLRTIAGAFLIAAAMLLTAHFQKQEIRKHTGRAVLRQIHIYGYGAEMILLYVALVVV